MLSVSLLDGAVWRRLGRGVEQLPSHDLKGGDRTSGLDTPRRISLWNDARLSRSDHKRKAATVQVLKFQARVHRIEASASPKRSVRERHRAKRVDR